MPREIEAANAGWVGPPTKDFKHIRRVRGEMHDWKGRENSIAVWWKICLARGPSLGLRKSEEHEAKIYLTGSLIHSTVDAMGNMQERRREPAQKDSERQKTPAIPVMNIGLYCSSCAVRVDAALL